MRDEVTHKVLLSTLAFLESLTKSDALTPDQMTEAHLAVTALEYEIARGQYDKAALEKIRAEERALADEFGRSLGKSADPSAVSRKWHERWRQGVGAELEALLASGGIAGGGNGDLERQMAQRLRDFLVAYHEPMDPSVGAGAYSTYKGGRRDSDEAKEEAVGLTASGLQEYLRSRFAEHASTVVRDLNRLMGGYSKETYIVTLWSEQAGETKIVIRKDGLALPTGSSVVDEYPVIQEVHAAGVPAPVPLWLEEDERIFGTAFMAVGFANGQPAHLHVPTDPAVRRKWSDSIALALAKLHKQTALPGAQARDSIREDIDALRRRVEERERDPHPAISFGLSWLEEHLDDLEGRPSCRTHGDVGFHNMMMKDDSLLVLLDWEFSHYSDPVEDLIYVKPFIDQLGTWSSFIDLYESASGFRYDAQAARYLGVWKEVRNAIACLGSLNTLLQPQVKSLALSVAGNVFIPKYEISILDAIINAGGENV